jgi:hypothetical protein
MNDSSSFSNATSPRPTLKLKVAPRKPVDEAKPATHSPPRSKSKPGAHWSDEYKERMQRDMDAMVR